jgi:SAM-dependent methyltransferase
MSHYGNIPCIPGKLDIFWVRNSIYRAIQENLHCFRGTLLDIGCGYMPYKELLHEHPSNVDKYIGLDLENNKIYQTQPDLTWDGRRIPLADCSVDCAIATELFEHCSKPELVMKEIWRVLKPEGTLFFTVPFLWPLHDVPHDEYRYTPFSLHRHLTNAGYQDIQLTSLGGWDAALAQMLGLWVRRRLRFSRKQRILRAILSIFILPIVWGLTKIDKASLHKFEESYMLTGISGIARKSIS